MEIKEFCDRVKNDPRFGRSAINGALGGATQKQLYRYFYKAFIDPALDDLSLLGDDMMFEFFDDGKDWPGVIKQSEQATEIVGQIRAIAKKNIIR